MVYSFKSDDESSEEEAENSETEMDQDIPDEGGSETLANGENENSQLPRVYLPGQESNPDVQLECDESAYSCFHPFTTGSPCLSFDIIPDNLGDNRADHYPLTLTLLGGTQHEKVHCNNLFVIKLSNMHQTKSQKDDENDDDEESDSDSDDEDSKPILECATVRHPGSVNRVKVTKFSEKTIASSWSELGKIFIWDLSHPLKAVNDQRVMTSYLLNNECPEPIFTYSGHLTEGYAMEWSPLIPGLLATGDSKKNIHVWKPTETGTWHVDQRPYAAHLSSVEDIQWSPSESNVMASCSSDKSIRIWDIRAAPSKACMITQENSHDSDVNVISWNKKDPFILSGGDDGKLRIWDLRKFGASEAAICTFKHHTVPITSVEWHPTDHSVFAASGADDQLTQWDLAAEKDDEQGGDDASPEISALPPQLLFIHQGQKEIKELHWHRQMPGVLISTALSGFNVIRTLSV